MFFLDFIPDVFNSPAALSVPFEKFLERGAVFNPATKNVLHY
jgi:hypothetical protein